MADRRGPSLEQRVEEVIQDHLAGHLRKEGPQNRRGRPPHRVAKFTIIEEAVRRKLAKSTR